MFHYVKTRIPVTKARHRLFHVPFRCTGDRVALSCPVEIRNRSPRFSETRSHPDPAGTDEPIPGHGPSAACHGREENVVVMVGQPERLADHECYGRDVREDCTYCGEAAGHPAPSFLHERQRSCRRMKQHFIPITMTGTLGSIVSSRMALMNMSPNASRLHYPGWRDGLSGYRPLQGAKVRSASVVGPGP